MKFKITEIDPLKIKVEYSDGSWAYIPTNIDGDKAYYAQKIVDFCNTPQEPVNISTLPYKVGDEGTVGDDVPEVEILGDSKINSSELRIMCYPSLEQQFDALFHARNGDTSKQTAIDGHIKLIKDSIPMDNTEYTYDEAIAKRKELVSNAAFVKDFRDT